MALTRRKLKELGIEADAIEEIVEEHSQTVEALKQQRDKAREEVEQYKEAAGKAAQGGEWKEKHDAVKAEFDDFKRKVEEDGRKARAKALYRAELEALGIVGKRADAVLRASEVGSFAVKDGKFEDPEAVREAIKAEWAEFIPAKKTAGAKVDNPPSGGKPAKTREQIAEMKDPIERQAAYAELLASEGE